MTPAQVRIREWRVDGIKFVRDVFEVEPDLWQKEVLVAWCRQDMPKMRISMQACVGPGKSAVMAWCAWHFLLTAGERGLHPKGAAVSITSDNLKDNLWAELSKWQSRSPLLLELFQWTATRVYAKDHPNTWFIAARGFSKSSNAEEQGRTLSGLHSPYVAAFMDETGDMPVAVSKAAEQSLAERDCKFGRLLQAGNPSSHHGLLYAAATNLSHLWHIVRITGDPDDPNRSPRIDIDWAREQIRTYGRDNPWVMYSILGLFPPSSINALLGPDDVAPCIGRHLREDLYNFVQKRIGIDVARFGDDRTIIFPRQGLASFKPVEMRGARTNDIAARAVLARNNWAKTGTTDILEFVDGTGGYGAGVIDSMRLVGREPIEVQFAGKATDDRYFNKRSEMWFRMAEWVKRGAALPNIPNLQRELTAPTYTFQNGKLRLEEKDQIKKRLGFSPDLGDALSTTFAHDDMPAALDLPGGVNRQKVKSDWDPYAEDRA